MTEHFNLGDHRIDPRTGRCVKEQNGVLCNRHVNDIMSGWREFKVGTQGVACYGHVNEPELKSYREYGEKRDAMFEGSFRS